MKGERKRKGKAMGFFLAERKPWLFLSSLFL
jgi:hypothetical protein